VAGKETVNTRALLEIVAEEVGHQVDVRNIPKMAVRVLGLLSPMMRELAEISYQFEQPFVPDTAKFDSTFVGARTPLATAIADTIAWYRNSSYRNAASRNASDQNKKAPR